MSMDKSSGTTSLESTPSSETSVWTPEHGLSAEVIISIRTLDEALDGFAEAWKSGVGGSSPRIDFASYELMHKVLAPNRVRILNVMTGAGPQSIREVARRVGRDFKGVHSDVTVLLRNGLLMNTTSGQVIFPYGKLHFKFEFGGADQSAA